ncbi:MAG: wax ester/triacylglycerol synthase family O-acyltransferase [Burkholderiales bacterium]|nr:wax ester/triacylglycerol synthase family O-acyltransferase [Burkholderiales bacterium]
MDAKRHEEHRLRPLSSLDALFLHLEAPEMPMHVAGLHLFEMPARRRHRYVDDVRRLFAARLHLAPAFTRRLAPMPLDLANPVWIEDETVDLDRHVQRRVLPRPGTPAQLHALVARLHAQPLDRARPLWQTVVIEGLAGGEVAVYTKIHHAAVDGAAGVALAAALMDLAPQPVPGRAARSKRAAHEYNPSPRELLTALGTGTLMQWRAVGALLPQLAQQGGKAALRALREALAQPAATDANARTATRAALRSPAPAQRSLSRSLLSALALAPRTPLNRSITPRRSLTTLSLPLPAIKGTAKALDATINDLVMAICATALRNWLARHDGVPRQPLVAAVPFSLRPAGDTAQNNQVSMMLTELATQEADPLKRLAAIRASMARGKRVIGGATSGLKALIPTDLPSLGTPWLISSLAALYARTHLADRMRPVANVVISNVMGAPVPLYMAGAKMTHYWPLSIVVHSVALNITVQSYDGRLEFGLVACRDALPRVDELAVLLQAAADEYEALASAHAARVLPATSPTTSPAAAATAAPARPPRKTPTRRRPSRQPS